MHFALSGVLYGSKWVSMHECLSVLLTPGAKQAHLTSRTKGSPDRWRRRLVPQGRGLTLMRRERRVLNLILLDIIVLQFLEAIPDRLSSGKS